MGRLIALCAIAGCASAIPRPHIGECEMPGDIVQHTLVGCVAFLPKYTEASCMYLDLGHTDSPHILTLRSEQCGPWEQVYSGPLSTERAQPDDRL